MLSRLLRVGVWAGMIGASALFTLLGFLHIRYPIERDYIEGVMMDHAIRIAHGQPLYAEPTIHYIALAYMPVFSTVVGLGVKLFGAELWVPRLLAVGCTLGIALLLGAIARAETRSWTFAVSATGLYLMGYGFAGGGHYDITRPDALMLLLSLGGLAVLRFTTDRRGALIAGGMLVVAFFTKQHAVWFGFAALAHLWTNDRKRFAPFAGVWVAGCAGGYLLLSLWLGPWFSYFTWDVPAHWSQPSWVRIQRYLGLGVLGTLGGLSVPTLLSLAQPQKPWRGPAGIWTWMGGAALMTGLMATLDPSAWHHVFIPTMMAFALLGPLALHQFARAFMGTLPAMAERVQTVILTVLLLQLVPLIYSVHGQMPHPGAAAARAAFEKRLAATPGPVLVICHGYYSWHAGKGMGAQIIALGDLVRSSHNRLERRDPNYAEKIIDPLLEGEDRPTLFADHALRDLGAPWDKLEGHYRLVADLGDEIAAMAPMSGERGYPRYVFAPAEAGAAPDSASLAIPRHEPREPGATP